MEYRDIGEDWRERDRVGKKVKRWVANYLAMPVRERRAILLSLLDAENNRLEPGKKVSRKGAKPRR
jgi:hypothetical protein